MNTIEEGYSEDLEPVRKRVRTSWSPEEERWLVRWVHDHVHSGLFSKRIDWRTCVCDIRKNPTAVVIFQDAHLAPTMLHEACKRIAKRRSVRVEELV